MRPYVAQIASTLRLMGRDRSVLFFSYLFPLVFFFLFAQLFGGKESGAAMAQVISMVLIIGVLGNGFLGQACAPCRTAKPTFSAGSKLPRWARAL